MPFACAIVSFAFLAQYAEVNAMHLANPYQLYSVLWKQLTGADMIPSKALHVGPSL
jgi:hypothetical protein